jgi:hypothetical protein
MSFPETHVLVELTLTDATLEPASAIPAPGATLKVGAPSIKRIVRTYLSRSRADEDIALLSAILPEHRFAVHGADHIDN